MHKDMFEGSILSKRRLQRDSNESVTAIANEDLVERICRDPNRISEKDVD